MGKQKLPLHYHQDWQRKRAEHDPEWYARRNQHRTEQRRLKKRRWVEKFGGQCVDCRGSFHPAAFDFHHIDEGSKDPKLGGYTNRVFMMSEKSIATELAKCILICANCHRTRHALASTSFVSLNYLKRKFG